MSLYAAVRHVHERTVMCKYIIVLISTNHCKRDKNFKRYQVDVDWQKVDEKVSFMISQKMHLSK